MQSARNPFFLEISSSAWLALAPPHREPNTEPRRLLLDPQGHIKHFFCSHNYKHPDALVRPRTADAYTWVLTEPALQMPAVSYRQ